MKGSKDSKSGKNKDNATIKAYTDISSLKENTQEFTDTLVPACLQANAARMPN